MEQAQRALCDAHGAVFVAAPDAQKVGIALHTLGRLPLNGLRHPPEGDTTGWYLYAGEAPIPQEDEEFFVPMHVAHLAKHCPQALPFLGLPPGYRFLIADAHVDVWFDEALLKLEAA